MPVKGITITLGEKLQKISTIKRDTKLYLVMDLWS